MYTLRDKLFEPLFTMSTSYTVLKGVPMSHFPHPFPCHVHFLFKGFVLKERVFCLSTLSFFICITCTDVSDVHLW